MKKSRLLSAVYIYLIISPYERAGKALIASILLASVMFFHSHSAYAAIYEYTYTGANFTDFSGLFNPFGSGDRITGTFTVDCSWDSTGGDCSDLPSTNLTGDVTSYFFEVSGVFSTDDFTAPSATFGSIHTDSSGNLTDWFIRIDSSTSGFLGIDALSGDTASLTLGSASNDIAGSWTRVEVIPIPPALWLFGSGLLGLIGIARRKKA